MDKVESSCGILVMVIPFSSKNDCGDFILHLCFFKLLIHVSEFSLVFALFLKKLSSLSIICLMSWFATRANQFSSFSSLYPLLLYNLYSFGCLPIIIDVSLALTAECQLHVDISHSSSYQACLLQIVLYLLFLQ